MQSSLLSDIRYVTLSVVHSLLTVKIIKQDIINKQKPAMFGDPQILEHWKMNFLGVN